MFNTGIFQHGIGELDDIAIDAELPKQVFSRWLMMSRPDKQDKNISRNPGGDSLAFRVMRECIPISQDPGCDHVKLLTAVDNLYEDTLAMYKDNYSGSGTLVLHKQDLAKYLHNYVPGLSLSGLMAPSPSTGMWYHLPAGDHGPGIP